MSNRFNRMVYLSFTLISLTEVVLSLFVLVKPDWSLAAVKWMLFLGGATAIWLGQGWARCRDGKVPGRIVKWSGIVLLLFWFVQFRSDMFAAARVWGMICFLSGFGAFASAVKPKEFRFSWRHALATPSTPW